MHAHNLIRKVCNFSGLCGAFRAHVPKSTAQAPVLEIAIFATACRLFDSETKRPPMFGVTLCFTGVTPLDSSEGRVFLPEVLYRYRNADRIASRHYNKVSFARCDSQAAWLLL
ncbi:hypothetical protein F9K79_21595 [Ochrobactrum sp. Kaboul]|nr:hypothetical protein F9K79_21595 [Ochrobactrum sp. Kaboul]